MASASIKTNPKPFTFVNTPFQQIYKREKIDSGEWKRVDYLYCTELVESEGSEDNWASFEYRAGDVLQIGATSFKEYDPVELANWFIRVDLFFPREQNPKKSGNQKKAKPDKTFYFQIMSDDRNLGGDRKQADNNASVKQPVRQKIIGVGLERVLAASPIHDAIISVGNEKWDWIDSHVAFNERYRRGLNDVGNRSKAQYTVDQKRGKSYVFTSNTVDDKDRNKWSVKDIIEYVIKFHSLKMNVKLPWSNDVSNTDNKLATALSKIYPQSLSLQGRSVKDCLDDLLSPERGLGWCLEFPQGKDPTNEPLEPQLKIFSIFNEPLKFADAEIPANKSVADLDLTNDNLVNNVVLGRDSSLEYGEIVVLGGNLFSCFSMSYADKTMDRGWSDAEETKLKTLLNTDADTIKSVDWDAVRNVYKKFKLIENWDGKTGDGEGGKKTVANPVVKPDCTIDTGTAAPLMRIGHSFEDRLPIERPQHTDSNPEKEYLEPCAYLRYKDDKEKYRWVQCDKASTVDQVPAQLRMFQNEPAVLLEASDDSAFAGTDPTDPTEKTAYDWKKDIILTVAMRTDRRIGIRKTLQSTSSKRLIINLPDAELWFIAEGTATGIKEDGTLDKAKALKYLRDDRNVIKDVAASAAKWYGTPRHGLQVDYRGFWDLYPIGTYISYLVTNGVKPINMPLTKRMFDFSSGRMTLVANHRPLNLGNL